MRQGPEQGAEVLGVVGCCATPPGAGSESCTACLTPPNLLKCIFVCRGSVLALHAAPGLVLSGGRDCLIRVSFCTLHAVGRTAPCCHACSA